MNRFLKIPDVSHALIVADYDAKLKASRVDASRGGIVNFTHWGLVRPAKVPEFPIIAHHPCNEPGNHRHQPRIFLVQSAV